MGPQQRKVVLFKDLGEEGYGEDTGRVQTRQSDRKGVTKVPSLLFDIELEDNAPEDVKAESDEVQDVLRQLKSLLQPWNAIELELHQQVQKANREATEEGSKLDAHQLAEKLDLPGHTFKVRAALGGSWSGDCLRQLRHFFLTCSMTGSAGPVTYVIDPCFRDQFEIANPTKQYTSILAEMPREFVGTEDRVSAVVTLLSNEIKRSFQVKGATLPPWRHPSSMLSKWRPRRSEDTPVGSRANAAGPVGTSPDHGNGKFASGKVDISASSLLVPEKHRAGEESPGHRQAGATHRGGVQADWPASGGNKRARDRVAEPKYSSLLAAKLRGVAYSAQTAFPGLCSKTGHT